MIITLVYSLLLTSYKTEESPSLVLFLATPSVPPHSTTTSLLLKFLISDFIDYVILFKLAFGLT